jgi:amphi-Trp domain-containing protein
MAKDGFEFGHIGTPDEIAEHLTSLAAGLKRGEVSLETAERGLRLLPPAELKLELKVREKRQKGRIEIELGWRRRDAPKVGELKVAVGSRPERA